MQESELYIRSGIALGMGLLVGLQREYSAAPLAGIRTFAIVALFGAVTGILATAHGAWVVAGGIVALGTLLATGHAMQARRRKDPGLTTEAAVLAAYGLAIFTMTGHEPLAVLLWGVLVLLLHWKQPLHAFVSRLEANEVRAIMTFVLIALVVLPTLPNRTFGPLQVLNAREIWIFVVLLVAIRLLGYLAYRLFGATKGTLIGAIAGGFASSTATTLAYARQLRGRKGAAGLASVIQIASTAAFLRAFFEIVAVDRKLLQTLGPPLFAVFGWMVLLSFAGYRFKGKDSSKEASAPRNPAELGTAVTFGIVYAVMLLVTAAVNRHFGADSLYVVALVSGLVDLDAITLTAAKLQSAESIPPRMARNLILTAMSSNLLFKVGLATTIAGRAVLGKDLPFLGATLLGILAVIFFWP